MELQIYKFGHYVRLTPRRPLSSLRERTKIPGLSSRYCPHCFKESGKKVRRKREYHLVGPLKLKDCDPCLSLVGPRISGRNFWWNKGWIRKMIAPPLTDGNWFESRPYAICPVHGKEFVHEIAGIRQFGKVRLLVFRIRRMAARVLISSFEWVIPRI